MKSKKIIIGSRGSKLALIYAKIAKNKIFNFKNELKASDIKIKIVRTIGDQIQNKRLSEIGGKGLFSKKIEQDLLRKKIDIAVHALKDMPTKETKGLTTICYLKRNDKVLIIKPSYDNFRYVCEVNGVNFDYFELPISDSESDFESSPLKSNQSSSSSNTTDISKSLSNGIIP